jgi:dienelactone hydrolase
MSTTLRSLLRLLPAMGLALACTARAAEPETVQFHNGQDVLLEGRLWRPADALRHPAVVMMHGCSGMYSSSDPAKGIMSLYREWGERLAAAGYVALLVDSFTPRGADQNQCGNGASGTSEIEDRPFDAVAAHSWLKQQEYVRPLRIGLLGWSHGASSTLATIEQGVTPTRPFRAAVAFYPGCGLQGAFGGTSGSTWAPITPVRILHAELDTLYVSGNCTTRVQHAAELTTVPARMRVYAGAQHSFDQATAVGGKWTQADVNAKALADGAAMAWFDRRLAN